MSDENDKEVIYVTKTYEHISYTPIATSVLWDKKLSIAAKGMYAIICATPPGWKSSVRGYANILKEGVTAIRSAIVELERAGLITRIARRDEDGKFAEVQYRPNVVPFTDVPTTETPSAESTTTENLTGNYICTEDKLDEHNEGIANKEEIANLLTADMSSFERYIRRSLSPSEVPIWERWNIERISPRLVRLAIEDNEFRRDKMTLHHVDDTIRSWHELGLRSIKDIENYILDNTYDRTRNKIVGICRKTGEDVNQALGGTKVAYIKGWRDDITGFCKDNSPEFVEATKLCPPEVFRYLPNNILDLMIHIYDKYNDAERKEAAKKALEKESNHE